MEEGGEKVRGGNEVEQRGGGRNGGQTESRT